MSFVNPLFLLGILTAAVPILLHLIKREHSRKMEFPTLMFLRRISRKTIRYQKLRHLLLLLLRVLAFMLIVLAFMRPYREKTQAAAAIGRVASTHLIAIDNSMSMDYQDRWRRTLNAAADIVRKSSPGDKYALLEFSDRVTALTPPTTDASEALAQIEDGVEPTDRSTRYGQALKAAERFALDAGTGKRMIHVISDFQKNGWEGEDQQFRLGAGIELHPIDVGSDEFSNLAIRDVRVIESGGSSSGSIVLKASVVCFGTQDRKNTRVSLSMDGRLISDRRVDVAKGESREIEFQLPGSISGIHSIVLEVDDPGLTRDNRFYLTVEARGKTPVVAVEDTDVRRQRAPSFFLAKALNIDSLSPYQLTVVTPRNLVVHGGLLIWNSTPAGSAITQQKLRDFVSAGGGLAVVLANSAQSADFNRSFGSWLPVKMTEAASSGERVRARPAEDYILLTDIRMDHPIFRPFSMPNSGIFSSAKFFDHARLSVGPGAEVIAGFDNGDPALVSVNIEKGRVLIFASSADGTSNDLPLKAIYAPFWQQMLRYLEDFKERRHWVNVGETMSPRKLLAEMAVRQAKGNLDINEAIVILDPRKRRASAAQGWDDVAMDMAGFYEIRAMNLNAAVAVNTTPRESDLTHGNAEEMTAGWISSEPAAFSGDEPPAAEELDSRERIWSLLLAAALLFLISESLVSNSQSTAGESRFKPENVDNR